MKFFLCILMSIGGFALVGAFYAGLCWVAISWETWGLPVTLGVIVVGGVLLLAIDLYYKLYGGDDE